MAKFKEVCMPAIFQNQAEKLGSKACVAYKKDGKFVDISWTDMNRFIHECAYYLLSIGIKKNDKVALFFSQQMGMVGGKPGVAFYRRRQRSDLRD